MCVDRITNGQDVLLIRLATKGFQVKYQFFAHVDFKYYKKIIVIIAELKGFHNTYFIIILFLVTSSALFLLKLPHIVIYLVKSQNKSFPYIIDPVPIQNLISNWIY